MEVFGERKITRCWDFFDHSPAARSDARKKRDYVATLRDPFLCHGHPCKENLNEKIS
jgi:hypothetical protein